MISMISIGFNLSFSSLWISLKFQKMFLVFLILLLLCSSSTSSLLITTSTYEEVNGPIEFKIFPVMLDGLPETYSDNYLYIGDYVYVNPKFQIASFSFMTIEIDAAGMDTSLFTNKKLLLIMAILKEENAENETSSLTRKNYQINVEKFLENDKITFNIFTVQPVFFKLFIGLADITDEYAEYSLINSTSISITGPMSISQENNTIFYSFADSGVQECYDNLYIYEAMKNTGFLISSSASKEENEIFDQSFVAESDSSEIPLPFLPFFMNCDTFGDFIPLGTVFTSKECEILDEDDVVVVGPFSFGQIPKADKCSNIEISCQIQEEFQSTLESGDHWYTLSKDDVLFEIYSDPLSSSVLNDSSVINDDEKVSAVIQNVAETNKFPLNIYLNFYYYQKDKETKKIITALVEFKGYEEPSIAQMIGVDPINYTVKVSLSPYSHRDLVTQFAFNFTIYLLISLGIGLMSVLMMSIFTGFNYLFAYFLYKKDEYPAPPKFNLMLYMKNTFPQIFLGIGMAMVPSMLYISLDSLLLGGHIL